MKNAFELEQTLVKLSVPFYMILVATELIVSNIQHKKVYTLKDTLYNAVFTTLNASIDLAFRGLYLIILVWFFEFKIFEINNKFVYWIALFVLQDLAYYTLHYVDHYCRFFWATHATHHSSEYFNITTGFRSSIFQPLYRFIYFIPLVIFGFHPADIILMYAITQLYGVAVHTNLVKSFGIIGLVFVDPSHHRVHHAANIEYLDKNMGMCLIIWDKIFGTFQKEIDNYPIQYGLTKPLEDNSILNTIFHEYKAIISDIKLAPDFVTALKYAFYPPGWSHNGISQTSAQMRNSIKTKTAEETPTVFENIEINISR